MLSTTILETCWVTIETFTDLESTISLSSTCRSLHSLLIDASTHKVKVTHFQVCNLPQPDNNDRSIIRIPRDYTTAHIRIPHYTIQALSRIHFPSLTKLHIDFPLARRRHGATGDARSDYIEDVHSAFPILASQLGASACNKLTSLYLNCNRLMQYETGGHLESTYEIFGQNLSRCCTDLKELSIVNTGMVRGQNTPMYSVGLTIALVLTLKRRKDTIRNFEYEVCGRPLLHRQYEMGGGMNIFTKTNCDLFGAVLQSTKLERLCVKCSFSHFCDFVRVAAMEEKATSIHDLTIVCRDIQAYERNSDNFFIPQVGLMLDHFSECRCLRRLHLQIPNACWGESQTLEALTNLLTNQPDLQVVELRFSGFDDREGRLLKFMSDMLARLAFDGCNMFRLFGLVNVDETQLLDLTRCMEALGFEVTTMYCVQFYLEAQRVVRSKQSLVH